MSRPELSFLRLKDSQHESIRIDDDLCTKMEPTARGEFLRRFTKSRLWHVMRRHTVLSQYPPAIVFRQLEVVANPDYATTCTRVVAHYQMTGVSRFHDQCRYNNAATGIAICGRKDEYNEARGIHIATARALDNLFETIAQYIERVNGYAPWVPKPKPAEPTGQIRITPLAGPSNVWDQMLKVLSDHGFSVTSDLIPTPPPPPPVKVEPEPLSVPFLAAVNGLDWFIGKTVRVARNAAGQTTVCVIPDPGPGPL